MTTIDKNKIVVGLDIGTTKVCAIVAQENEYGKIDILGVGKSPSEGVRRGSVENVDKTVEAIRSAIQIAGDKANADIDSVYVGIAGEHIRSKQEKSIITLNGRDAEITQRDLERLREDVSKTRLEPGNEIFHVLPQEYTVDGQRSVRDPIGMSGIRLECDYHIVYGQATTARNIARCVERAGLFVEGLVLQPLASSYAVLSDEEKEAGVCLIDIGGGTTDIAIFQEDIIRHTCVIPFGGNVVTEDISQGLGIMRKYAEKLKRDFGMAVASEADPNEFIEIQGMQNKAPKDISRQTLAAIIEARMFEIIGLAWKEIQRVRYHDKLIGGIVVTGGGAELHGIQHLIEAITGVDTRVGYPTEHLSNGMVPEVNHPLYATGIGLAIYGLRNSFNFSRIPASFSNIAFEKEKKTAKVEAVPKTAGNARPAGIWQNIKNWFEKSINSASQAID